MINLEHPRYLLGIESMCYGCYYYDSLEEIDPEEDFSAVDIDENGGFCNCNSMCVNGSMWRENRD